MTDTITITVPAHYTVKAQHIETAVDASTFHVDSLAYIFKRGLERSIQDHVNTTANNAKKAGTDIDARDITNKRIASFVDGTFGERGESTAMPPADVQDAQLASNGTLKNMIPGMIDVLASVKGESADARYTAILALVDKLAAGQTRRQYFASLLLG